MKTFEFYLRKRENVKIERNSERESVRMKMKKNKQSRQMKR